MLYTVQFEFLVEAENPRQAVSRVGDIIREPCFDAEHIRDWEYVDWSVAEDDEDEGEAQMT